MTHSDSVVAARDAGWDAAAAAAAAAADRRVTIDRALHIGKQVLRVNDYRIVYQPTSVTAAGIVVISLRYVRIVQRPTVTTAFTLY